MRFQVGTRLILKQRAKYKDSWPELIGVPATVLIYQDHSDIIIVVFDGIDNAPQSWDYSHFDLYQDGLERILDKL